MTRSRLLLAIAAGAACLLAGCDRQAPHGATAERTVPGTDSAARRTARDVVTRFGSRMQTVSLLAPDSVVSAEMRDAYGALVTPELLAEWMAHPDRAPGRRVSSPWPDHIRVDSVRAVTDRELEVTGAVVYATSAERARGEEEGEGKGARSEPVRLRVGKGDDGSWRIRAYAQGARPAGD
ncbi:MAG TPA: hypothetical protein VF041_00135 [Gemmatimonadaceae bacterium]